MHTWRIGLQVSASLLALLSCMSMAMQLGTQQDVQQAIQETSIQALASGKATEIRNAINALPISALQKVRLYTQLREKENSQAPATPQPAPAPAPKPMPTPAPAHVTLAKPVEAAAAQAVVKKTTEPKPSVTVPQPSVAGPAAGTQEMDWPEFIKTWQRSPYAEPSIKDVQKMPAQYRDLLEKGAGAPAGPAKKSAIPPSSIRPTEKEKAPLQALKTIIETGDARAVEKFLQESANHLDRREVLPLLEDPFSKNWPDRSIIDFVLPTNKNADKNRWEIIKNAFKKGRMVYINKRRRDFPELAKKTLTPEQAREKINAFIAQNYKDPDRTLDLNVSKALDLAREHSLVDLEKQMVANLIQNKIRGSINHNHHDVAMSYAQAMGDRLDQKTLQSIKQGLKSQLNETLPSDPTWVLVNASRYGIPGDREYNFFDLAQAAIKAGANIEKTRDPNDLSALHWAAITGNAPIANLVLHEMKKKNMSVDIRDNQDGTPLIKAADNGKTELVKLLLANGANPNAQQNAQWGKSKGGKNRNALHATLRMTLGAAQKSSAKNYHSEEVTADIVNQLMNAGADPYVKDCPWELTILDWAISNNFTQVFDAIIAARVRQLDGLAKSPATNPASHPEGPCKPAIA